MGLPRRDFLLICRVGTAFCAHAVGGRCRYRDVFLMPVRGPATAILSFAWPKESIQRKGHPDAALILRAVTFVRGFSKGHPSPCEKRAASLPHPCGQFLTKAPVLGVAKGDKPRPVI